MVNFGTLMGNFWNILERSELQREFPFSNRQMGDYRPVTSSYHHEHLEPLTSARPFCSHVMHPGSPPNHHVWDMRMEGCLTLVIDIAWFSIKNSSRCCFLDLRGKKIGKQILVVVITYGSS
jgi:hypothetical protein